MFYNMFTYFLYRKRYKVIKNKGAKHCADYSGDLKTFFYIGLMLVILLSSSNRTNVTIVCGVILI